MAYLIPNQYSQLTSKHPSFLTYFHPILSHGGLSWSVNYIDLTPYRTHKWKCHTSRPLPQQETGSHHYTSKGAWLNTSLPQLQVSKDTWWEMPPPLLIELGSTPYIEPYCATIVLRVTSLNNHSGQVVHPIKTALTIDHNNI